MKQTIRLTESQLTEVISKTVKKVLREYKDKNFKYHEGDKVTFTLKGDKLEGVISDYDYNPMTFKQSYDVEYLKDGKTWTAIGVPEEKIIDLIEVADDKEYQKRYNWNKFIKSIS